MKTFIPCNLAFTFDYNGEEFSIGTPIHTQVAVYCENDEGSSYFIDPDEDDNLEIMEMAAAKFESINNCQRQSISIVKQYSESSNKLG